MYHSNYNIILTYLWKYLAVYTAGWLRCHIFVWLMQVTLSFCLRETLGPANSSLLSSNTNRYEADLTVAMNNNAQSKHCIFSMSQFHALFKCFIIHCCNTTKKAALTIYTALDQWLKIKVKICTNVIRFSVLTAIQTLIIIQKNYLHQSILGGKKQVFLEAHWLILRFFTLGPTNNYKVKDAVAVSLLVPNLLYWYSIA